MAHSLAIEIAALKLARIHLTRAATVLDRLAHRGPTSARLNPRREGGRSLLKPAPRLDFSPHGRSGTP